MRWCGWKGCEQRNRQGQRQGERKVPGASGQRPRLWIFIFCLGGVYPAYDEERVEALWVPSFEAKLNQLGGTARPPKVLEETWTCKHCKAEKCFASRTKCYKCGEAREAKVPTPPGLGTTAAPTKPSAKDVAPMEEEVAEEASLEDQIAEAEDNLKVLKGKASAWATAQRSSLEAHLKGLKDQQRLARPIPVRLQAAPARVTKTGQEVEDSEAKIAAIEKTLAEAVQERVERNERHQAALQELEAVKQAAGAEPVDEAEKGLAAGIFAALSARQITGTDAQAFLAEVVQFYGQVKKGGGFSQVQGQQVVRASQSGAAQSSGAVAVFAPGGAFPSALVGASPFQVVQAGPPLGDQGGAAKAAAAAQQEERLVWEQARAEELVKLKAQLEAQRLKHGALVAQLTAAQEEAKKAKDAGGGSEEAAKVAQLMTEGCQVLTVLEGMEKSRLELESEAFGKAPAKVNRGSPY